MIKMSELSEKDKKEMNEAIDETGTVQKEHSMTVSKPAGTLKVPHVGGDIEGMQDLPASMIALPYVKLVQKSSSKTILTDGKDATPGLYYFTDTQTVVDTLNFIILRAKVVTRDYIRDGESVKVTQLMSLSMSDDFKKLFILLLPITSFTSWGKLIAKFKEMGIESAWEYAVTAKSIKRENTKGQFFVADIQIGRKLIDKEQEAMADKYGEYGGVLERRDIMEEAENQEDV